MNKRGALSAAIAVSLAVMLILTACGGGDTGETVYSPVPTEITVEESPNSAGRRFRFTLDELSDRINGTVDSIFSDSGDDNIADIGEWSVLAEGLIDDNGIRYTSYSSSARLWTLTAAVEDESEKVINLGCGCGSDMLKDTKYRDIFITYAAILAASASGYDTGDVPFLKGLLYELYGGVDRELFYEQVLYSISREDETVLVIFAPSSAAKAKRDGAKFYDVNG